ncbi:MAG: MFS transporter [Leptospirales bacterium]|nr:MFS transporter [Leptospirales bacterium]
MAHDPLGALRIPAFRNYILAKLLFVIAAQVQIAAVRWQVYSLTKDPLALGMIGLVEAIAFIAVALVGGHLADRLNPSRIILICLLILLSCSLMLARLASSISILTVHGVWPIYGVIAVSGAARGFLSPALFSYMTSLIPPKDFANSSAWSSGSWQLAAVAGPALGGIIYGASDASITYLTDAALVVAAIFFAWNSKRQAPTFVPPAPSEESLGGSLSAGLRFVFSNQIMLGAMSLDLFAVLFGGAVALIPMFADQILMSGPETMGLLLSSPAVGAVSMALLLAFFPLGKHAGWILLIAVLGFGLCMIGFGLSKSLYLSVGFLVFSGVFDSVSVVIRGTIMQRFTPENMRGRVSAVNSIFIGSSNEIGAFESGLAAKLLGLVPSVVFGGIMTIATVTATMVVAPKLRQLDLRIPQEQ